MLPNRTNVCVPLNGPFAEIYSGRTMHAPISAGGHKPFPVQPCHLRWPDEVPVGTAFVRAFIPCANYMRNLQLMQRQLCDTHIPKQGRRPNARMSASHEHSDPAPLYRSGGRTRAGTA